MATECISRPALPFAAWTRVVFFMDEATFLKFVRVQSEKWQSALSSFYFRHVLAEQLANDSCSLTDSRYSLTELTKTEHFVQLLNNLSVGIEGLVECLREGAVNSVDLWKNLSIASSYEIGHVLELVNSPNIDIAGFERVTSKKYNLLDHTVSYARFIMSPHDQQGLILNLIEKGLRPEHKGLLTDFLHMLSVRENAAECIDVCSRYWDVNQTYEYNGDLVNRPDTLVQLSPLHIACQFYDGSDNMRSNIESLLKAGAVPSLDALENLSCYDIIEQHKQNQPQAERQFQEILDLMHIYESVSAETQEVFGSILHELTQEIVQDVLPEVGVAEAHIDTVIQ